VTIDIERIYSIAKNISKTRDERDLVQSVALLDSISHRTHHSARVVRIYKYALGAARLIAGEAAIEFAKARPK
jgi:hypothetical protein